LHDRLDPQQKHLLQVEEMQRSDWLICQSASKFVTRQVVSLMKNEQQSQNLLYKVDPRSTFRSNKKICCGLKKVVESGLEKGDHTKQCRDFCDVERTRAIEKS